MADYEVTGRRVLTYIEIAQMELELEANYLIGQMEIQYQQLLTDGYTANQASKIVLTGLANEEDFVRTWMTRNKRVIDRLHSEMVATPVKEWGLKNKKQKFIWSLDAAAAHCGDCEALASMEAKTIRGWLDEGYNLPRQGGTLCSYGCKCMLVAV